MFSEVKDQSQLNEVCCFSVSFYISDDAMISFKISDLKNSIPLLSFLCWLFSCLFCLSSFRTLLCLLLFLFSGHVLGLLEHGLLWHIRFFKIKKIVIKVPFSVPICLQRSRLALSVCGVQYLLDYGQSQIHLFVVALAVYLKSKPKLCVCVRYKFSVRNFVFFEYFESFTFAAVLSVFLFTSSKQNLY